LIYCFPGFNKTKTIYLYNLHDQIFHKNKHNNASQIAVLLAEMFARPASVGLRITPVKDSVVAFSRVRKNNL
jgi:hypothetical protein